MRSRNGLVELILYVAAFAGAAIMLMPFVWMLVTSLKLPEEVQVWPPTWGTVNALSSRTIQAGIDHSAYSSVNYGALSLQQFLSTGSSSKEKELPNTLTVNLIGTAPVRGRLTLILNDGNPLEYATAVNVGEVKRLMADIDSMGYPKDYANQMRELKDLEARPIEYVKAFFDLFEYGKDPVLSRINYVKDFTKSVENTGIMAKRYAELLANNPRLAVGSSDSSSLVAQKKRMKEFFASDPFTAEAAKVVSEVTVFKKGLGTLALNATEVQAGIDGFLSEIDLKAVMDKEFGSVDPSLLSIVNLYQQRVVDPIKEWANLLKAFTQVNGFYDSSKNMTLENPEIAFDFPSAREQKNRLETAVKGSSLSSEYSGIALKMIVGKNPADFMDNFINSINAKVTTYLENQGLTVPQAGEVQRKFSDVVNNLNILYSLLSNGEKQRLDAMIKSDSGDWTKLSEDISKAFGAEHPNTTQVLTGDSGQLVYVEKQLEGYPNPSKVESELSAVWENKKALTVLTGLYNDAFYTMNVVKAPPIVSKVQYFPQSGNIKIFFSDVNSVWFSGTKVSVVARFNLSQIMANIFQNYVDAWNAAPFARYYLNTVFVATLTTVLSIIVGVMAAFAFSKLHFFGRDFFFMLFLATMMIPGEVLLVPNYITIVKFGWMNTYYALIVPWIASAFVIFLMRQNFMTVPDELFDAAKIDGASKWRFLWTILVPLSRPVIITGALLNFVGSWNSFLWVLIVTDSPGMRTLPVGLQNFSSNAGTVYNQLMAASTFSMLPIVILFLVAQRYFIQGIARSGLK